MRELLSACVLMGLALAPAPRAQADVELTRHCREAAALVGVALAVDEQAGGTRGELLLELAESDQLFGEVAGSASPASIGAMLHEAERLERRLVELRSEYDAGRMTGARLRLARHCARVAEGFVGAGDEAFDLSAARWVARHVARACEADRVDSEAVARSLATRLVDAHGRLDGLDERGDEDSLLAAAAGLLYAQPHARQQPEVLAMLERIEVPVEHIRDVLRGVRGDLGGLVQQPDASALAGALRLAADNRAMVERNAELRADWEGLFEGLVALGLEPGPVASLPGDFDELDEDWRGAFSDDPAATTSLAAEDLARAQVVVLGAGGARHELPSAAQLGRAQPALVPGLRYLLATGAGARLLVELPADARGAVVLQVPDRVPVDTLLAFREDALDKLVYVRARPWSLGEWLGYLDRELGEHRSDQADTGALFAMLLEQAGGLADLDPLADDERAEALAQLEPARRDARAVLGAEELHTLGNIDDFGDFKSLERLLLPETDDAAWLRAVVAPAFGWELGEQRLLTEGNYLPDPGDLSRRVTVDFRVFRL